ncbi:MAG: ankyrin repeat domain-containing protein, partial [Candidatus Micrarchaeota archaeon]|nr:ankyrin repeat domain-containing protein [Candidatus Micrarchaeota archaeon]
MAQRLGKNFAKKAINKPDLARQKLSTEKRNVSPEKQKQFNSMLLDAALIGNVKRVERLLKAGADVNTKYKKGWTALMYAAGNGHSETTKILIENGADVNAKKKDGE